MEKYERVLAAEPEINDMSLCGQDTLTREREMSALVARKLGDMTKRQWRLNIGKSCLRIRDQVDRIVKIVLVANRSITVAVNTDPMHAGLAWAPICLLLSVCFQCSPLRG